MTCGSLEYAYARLAARHGQRLDEPQWHRIELPRTLAGVIDAVRVTPLERWVSGLTSHSDAHAIDARLREQWRSDVDEVARWMPERWQSAVRWWATLPDVPIVAHLVAGGAPQPWMRTDGHYRPLLEPGRSASHPLLPLWPPRTTTRDVARAWYGEWKRRVPRGDAGPLPALERTVRAHLAAFAALAPGDGTALRRTLKAGVSVLFRRAIATPAAAFVYLVLALIDAERLRGELMRRAAFPGLPLAR